MLRTAPTSSPTRASSEAAERTPSPAAERAPSAAAALALTFLLLLPGCAPEAPPPEHRTPDARQEVATDRAPEAIGPYSQAVRAGNTLYLAGQIALDPNTGEMVEGGIEAETHRVMQNLGAVLEAAGLNFGHVVQSQVFLVDLADFGAMNRVYGDYLTAPYPARATVEVAGLPRGALVEIQMVAVE